jgi:hypothetical protein
MPDHSRIGLWNEASEYDSGHRIGREKKGERLAEGITWQRLGLDLLNKPRIPTRMHQQNNI